MLMNFRMIKILSVTLFDKSYARVNMVYFFMFRTKRLRQVYKKMMQKQKHTLKK